MPGNRRAHAHPVQEAKEVGWKPERVVSRELESRLPVRQAINERTNARIGHDGLPRGASLGILLGHPEHGGHGHEAGEGLVAQEERGPRVPGTIDSHASCLDAIVVGRARPCLGVPRVRTAPTWLPSW